MTNAMTLGVNVQGYVSSNSWNYYHITPNSANNMVVSMNQTVGGDCDLYIKVGANPTQVSYDYRDIGIALSVRITVPNPAADTWYFGVYGFSSCSYLINVVVNNQCPGTPPCSGHGTCSSGSCVCTGGYAGSDCSLSHLPELSNGVATTGTVSTTIPRWQFYQISVSGTTFLTIDVKETATVGFVWVYVSKTTTPDLHNYDFSDQETNSQFHRIHITFDERQTDTWVIGVYSNPFAANVQTVPFTISAWYSPF